jgi:hypothetical protein
MTTDIPPKPTPIPVRIGCGLVGLSAIAVGLFCALLAWRGAVEWTGFEAAAHSWGRPRVEGTVVRTESGTIARTHHGIVRYEVAGRAFETTAVGRRFKVGETVSVAYDPAAPAGGQIVGYEVQYHVPVAILVVSIFLLVLGVAAVRLSLQRV